MDDTNAALVTRLRLLDASLDELATSGDFEKLASCLADDFRYNHSTGLSQSKDEWLEGLKPLVGRRDRIAGSIQVEMHGDVAVVFGDLDVVWKDGRHAFDRYVRVYRETNGDWRAVSQRTVPAHDRAPS
jgi:ketosteroid isomerase-like protein